MGFYHSCLVAQQNLSFSFCCSCRLQLRLGCRKPFIQCRRLSGLNNSRKCNTQFSKTAKFIDFVTGYLTLFTQLLSIVKASMAALLGSLPQYHPIVGNAAEQQELSGQRSVSLYQTVSLSARLKKCIHTKSLFKNVPTLGISVFHLFRPLKGELFSFLPFTSRRVTCWPPGSQPKPSQSLQPKPSSACEEWLTSICLALADHCQILRFRYLHLPGNEVSFDEY